MGRKMLEVFESIFSVVIFVISIYLIVSGVSKTEKYLSAEFIKKRNLIFGVVLIVATLLSTDWNGVKKSFTDGYNAGSDIQVDDLSK